MVMLYRWARSGMVLQDWIVESEIAFLGEQHDHRGSHRLGIRCDPKWVSALGGLVAPSNVVPELTVKSPWGVRNTTTAPGIRSSLAVVSTIVCSAALSIGLSADSCCLWHDESPVGPQCNARHKSDGNDLEFSFHFRPN